MSLHKLEGHFYVEQNKIWKKKMFQQIRIFCWFLIKHCDLKQFY